MEIVIKIPNKDYSVILTKIMLACHGCKIIELPKGHGRLIEVNKLLNMTESYKSELGGLKADPFVKSGIETVESFIKELPTIIEADKDGDAR